MFYRYRDRRREEGAPQNRYTSANTLCDNTEFLRDFPNTWHVVFSLLMESDCQSRLLREQTGAQVLCVLLLQVGLEASTAGPPEWLQLVCLQWFIVRALSLSWLVPFLSREKQLQGPSQGTFLGCPCSDCSLLR